MFFWFKKSKTRLQKLQHQYCKLMKTSYVTALKDKKKSDVLHDKANKILLEIKKMEHQMQ